MNRIVDISSQELCQVPDSIFGFCDVQKLILDYNDIATFPTNFCFTFAELSFFSVNGNSLETLPCDIGLIKSLTELQAKENSLTEIPDSLCDLNQLIRLHLTGNSIARLPTNFYMLCSLTELIIDENELTHLPKNFGMLNNLTFLDLSNNLLWELPDDFGMLKSLKYLNLSNNNLKNLPDSFENLPSLEILDLTGNAIKSIPNKSLSSKSIIKLLVNENSLTGLPDWLSESKNLKELYVSGNGLLEMPKDFGIYNCELELINLSGNNITELPENIGSLNKLKYLDLGSALDELERNQFIANGNDLKKLPDSFTNLKNLIKLELDENKLYELPTNFGQLTNLTYLDLCHNELKFLPDSFCLLKNLKICLLSMNLLEELPINIGKLCVVEDLKLDNNKLSDLPESFSNLVTLTSLDLYKNCLKEIPKSLNALQNLKHLDLRENDLGLDLDKIPEINYEPTYVMRKPELNNTWRGRERPDISQSAWVDSKVNVQDDSKLNDNVLYAALTSASTLWRKHGQLDLRSMSEKNNSPGKDIELNNATELNNSLIDEEEFWDQDIYDEINEDNSSLEPIDFDSNLNALEKENDSESSGSENKEKFVELSDWESDDSSDYMPNNFRKVYRHPVKEVVKEAVNILIPSDLHVNRIQVKEEWQPCEDGQFEDA